MKKEEICNEIVSLRQTVRQARICIINKLVREAKRLRTSHGNEKQRERNQNKVDKLLREVFALKSIKDDDISKFGIVKSEYLQNLLQNPSTDDGTRAMIKIVRYKSLNARIMEFKEKFPDYKEYISWRKKKLPQKRKKITVSAEQAKETTKCTRADSKGRACMESIEEKADRVSFDHEPCSTEQQTTQQDAQCHESSQDSVEPVSKINKMDKKSKMETENVEKSSGIKAISKEASVKRFTEILQETNVQERNEEGESSGERSCRESVGPAKEVDDFFLNADGAPHSSNTVPFSRESHSDNESNTDRNPIRDLRSRSGKGKFHRDKGNKERKSNGKRKADPQDRYHDQTNTQEADWKRNRKDARVERRSTRNNPVQAASTVKNEQLHPSWAAKKKQQEILKQGFQGKKIQFDDDD